MINNPEGADFVDFLKDRFFRFISKTQTINNTLNLFHRQQRTGQNAIQSVAEMNTFIINMYKSKYYVNKDAAAPEIPDKTLRKLRKLMKVKKGSAKAVSARRWEAMGDPRNYISWYCTSSLAFRDVPLELRFNWDDTSLFVSGEDRNGCVGIAFTADEVAEELKLLNRSLGVQMGSKEKGHVCTPRLVQWGFLASASGRLECVVVKVYDRSISVEDNLDLVHIKKVGDTDIHVLFIRGKQLAPGADAPAVDGNDPDAIAHFADHATECDVAEKVFGEVVVPKIEKRKAEYAVVMKRIKEQGFGAKVGSPEYQQHVTEQMELMRQQALDMHGPFVARRHLQEMELPHDDPNYYEGFSSSSSDDDAPAAAGARMGTPASFVRGRSGGGGSSSSSSSDESSSDSSSSSSSSSSDDVRTRSGGKRPKLSTPLPKRSRFQPPGMGTASSCAHLPESLDVPQHIHKIYKQEQAGEYACGVCGGKGAGGLVYACDCDECAGWCSHLRCVLPQQKKDKADTRMLLNQATVTSMFTLPAQANISECFGQRAVLCMDGCNGQVRAAVGTADRPGVLEKLFFPAGIDIIKGSAQCSPSQNPLDCMRSFMNIKRSKPTWTWSNASASTEMRMFVEEDGKLRTVLKKCSATDVNSFVLSFMHLERTISTCFTQKIMQSGWAKAGLIGLELHQVMSHWIGIAPHQTHPTTQNLSRITGWKKLPAKNIAAIIDLLPAFFYEVAETGILSDASMEAMQPHFDVDFHHYAVDRSRLTTSRTRAQHMTVFQRILRQKAVDEMSKYLRQNADEEKRPEHPKRDGKNLCICPCKGRHYVDDDASWKKHCGYKKHMSVADAVACIL